MKKIVLIALCAGCIPAYALPTYEPFTEYAANIATNTANGQTNSINLCIAGLVAPSGEPWLNQSFSGTAGTGIKGLDVQVTNNSASVFTSNNLFTLLPTTFPGYPGFGSAITTIVMNPAQPANANTVGNSAVLQFAQDFTRPASGTKTLFVSYLFDDIGVGQTGNGNNGRYLDFVASSNVVEGAGTTGFYKTWSTLYNTYAVNTGPRYFGHAVRYPNPLDVGPTDSASGSLPSPLSSLSLAFNTAGFVVGEYIFVSTNASAGGTKDTNILWLNPPLSSFGGPTPATTAFSAYAMAITMNDVGGLVIEDRVGSGALGGVNTTYNANLMLGSTWSYVTGGPEFTLQPAGAITNYGSTLTLSAAATAAGQTVAYQWAKVTATTTNSVANGSGGAGGGATVSGATSGTLTLAGLSAGDFGSYQLVATASSTGFSLASTTVAITADPLISAQPQNASAALGGTAVFSVSATTQFGSLTYQWQMNGAPLSNGTLADGSVIAGATNPSLTLSDFQLDENGAVITCAVTNSLPVGEISAGATLSLSDPAITSEPQPVTLNYGGTATFSVAAQTSAAHAPLQYAWYNGSTMLVNGLQADGSTVSGATGTSAGATLSSTLTLNNVSYLDDGSYSLVVTNSVNSTATSTAATLFVNDPYIGVEPPATVEVAQGGNTTISIVAGGSGATYQWSSVSGGPLSNSGDDSGVTTPTLTISGAQASDAGTYYLTITGNNGTLQSSDVNVVVETAATAVSVSPATLTQQAGTHLALAGTVTGGSGLVHFLWTLNGGPVADGTKGDGSTVTGSATSTLVLGNIQVADSGTYTLIASNAAGSVSASDTVTVSAGLLPLATSNLVVTRVGEGAEALSGATGNTMYLDQFTTNGGYVSTIMVPDFGTSALIVPGAGTDGQNESYLTLSSNGQYLNMAGYFYNYPFQGGSDVTVGGTTGIRSIGAVNGLGYYMLAYTNYGLYSGGAHFIRSAYSTDGLMNFWTTGAAGATAIKYVNAGPTGAGYATGNGIPGLSTAVAGPRCLGLMGPNLVFSDNGDTGLSGLDSFTGAPEIQSATALLFASGSPADFAFSPDSNTVYVADDSAAISGGTGYGGGIQRWDLESGVYTYSYNLEDTTGVGTNGAKGLAVVFPSSITAWGQGVTGAVLYATTSEAVSNRLIQFVDTGVTSTPALLATAGPNQFLRGVRFGPVSLPAEISAAPQPVNTYVGQTATLTVGVTGDAPFSYQWQFDGTNIAGATASSLVLSNLQAANSGTYSVTVTNTISTNSSSAVVSVGSGPPVVVLAPQSRVESVGDHLAFTIAATGTLPIYYQWESNGVAIAGATGTAYALANIAAADSATYSVVYTNIFGATTNSATLQVTTSLQALSSNNLVVARVGDGVEPLSSTTANTLYLDQLTPAGVYSNTIMIPDNDPTLSLLVLGGPLEGPEAGVLTLSENGTFLNFGGFNTEYPATAALNVEGIFRAIGAVNAFGYYQLAQDNETIYDGSDYFNGVVSHDGFAEFWTTGTAGSPPAIKYATQATAGSGGGNVALGGSAAGTRVVNIVSGNVVYSDTSSSPPGIWAFSGEPTAAAGSAALITDAAGNPNDFAASPDTTTFPPSTSTVYVGDTSSIANGGGVQRYDWNGSAYALSYTLGTRTGSTVGASCLAVDFSANATWGTGVTGAIIYATTTGNPGNSLIKIVDTGTSSSATVLQTANANEILRGVRFGPVAGPPIIVTQPQSTNAFVGGTAVFTVPAVQNGPITGYQWQLNGTNLNNGPSVSGSGAAIIGAQTNSLTVTNVGAADDQGNYTVIVSNLDTSAAATSAVAVLTVPVNLTSYPAAFQTVAIGGTATFTVGATGGAPLSYQWSGPCGTLSDGPSPCGGSSAVIAGSSTGTLTIANAAAADSGSYSVTVSNPESSTNTSSQQSVLLVYSGPPIIVTDIQPSSLVQPVGFKAVFTVTAAGTQPLSYQWQLNGANLTDNGHVTGSQTSTLTIANGQVSDSGSYQLIVTNSAGSNNSSAAPLTVTLIGFNTGAGWSANGDASITSGALSLTQGGTSETSSAFLSEPVDVAAFLASWTYQDISGANSADGTAFVLQNTAAGAAAMGAGGGDLGYITISNSIAFEFNIYNPNTIGIAIGTNGLGKDGTTATGGGPYAPTGSLNLASGDPIGVTLTYLGGVASLTLTDAVATVSFTTNYNVNVPGFVGSNTAYVGFTGAAGGTASSQTVSDFFFTSLTGVTAQSGGSGTLVLTWPVAAAGFTLQQSSSLSDPDWVNVTNLPVVVNGQNQITVTPSGTAQYYRLNIQ